MDVSQYLEIFIEESKEHLQTLNDQILILENEPDNTDTINEIFRAAHSLKGMAGTMGYTRMQNLTHHMEDAFSEVRSGKMKATPTLVDLLFKCIDAIEAYVDSIASEGSEGEDDHNDIIDGLNAFIKGEEAAPASAAPAASASSAPEASAPASSANADVQYKTIKYADFERHAIEEAIGNGLKVYAITVYIDPNCLLKAARAFLVFKALEPMGEIIKSEPSVQDVEDEKFDFEFSIVFLTEASFDKVVAAIKNVSEIKDAVGEELKEVPAAEKEPESAQAEAPKASEEVKKTEEKKEEESADNKPAVKESGNNTPATKPGAKSKPVINRSVRVDIEKLDVLMNLVSELIIAKNGLVSASADMAENGGHSSNFHEQIEYLERVTTNLHESVMKVRMMPIESVVNKFPRMIRDLSKKLDKKMELYMTGEETELDRTVIDEIGDPLMHLLRNSADHGLESADVRLKRGKPEVGSIFLNAYQDGNNVVIEVRDDGNGIDIEKVRQKAIDKGTITEEQAAVMTDKDIVDLLFRPSFSTAEKISDVSGRGVGLDVVKSKIEALGGDVEVKTEFGVGSTFIIRLPLTLAIIQALMVQLGDEKYAIALGSIQTLESINVSEIKYVHAKEVIHLRGSVIPLVRLRDVLKVPGQAPDTDVLTVVIVKKGDRMAGLVVDNLIGQLEIVIKSLGKYIKINRVISGATILGDGEVALIIDANALV